MRISIEGMTLPEMFVIRDAVKTVIIANGQNGAVGLSLAELFEANEYILLTIVSKLNEAPSIR